MAQDRVEVSRTAAGEVFRRHRRDVQRFFEQRLADRSASEDLCQEVFLRFVLAEAAGVALVSPERWLRRAAINLLIDTYRRARVSRARELTLANDDGLPADARTVADHLEQGELAGSISEAFAALGAASRRLLYWREVMGLPVRTIANRLGTSEGVVATELSRARKRFRQAYLRVCCSGMLEPDEEIFDEPSTLRSFDPLGRPEEQLATIARRGLAYFEAMAPTCDVTMASTYTQRQAEQVVHSVPVGPDVRVLDAGTGTGYLALHLAPRVREVVAVDQSPGMLRQVAAKASRDELTNVRLCQAPVERMPLEAGTFDLVVSRMLLHHVLSPRTVLRELRRLVRPGGLIVLVDSDRHAQERLLTEHADVHRGFDRRRLWRQVQRAGFKARLVQDAGTWHAFGDDADRFSAFLLVASR